MYIIKDTTYYSEKDLDVILYPGKVIKVFDTTNHHRYHQINNFPRPVMEPDNGFYKFKLKGTYIVMTTDGFGKFKDGKFLFSHRWEIEKYDSISDRATNCLY